MYLSAYFPLWRSTLDSRRIAALGIMRPLPLPLLAMPEASQQRYGATAVGRVVGVTFVCDRLSSRVLCTCRLDDGIPAHVYKGWYLGPDLDSVRAVARAGVMSLTGNLLGATLDPRPVWPNHEPVYLHEELER